MKPASKNYGNDGIFGPMLALVPQRSLVAASTLPVVFMMPALNQHRPTTLTFEAAVPVQNEQ